MKFTPAYFKSSIRLPSTLSEEPSLTEIYTTTQIKAAHSRIKTRAKTRRNLSVLVRPLNQGSLFLQSQGATNGYALSTLKFYKTLLNCNLTILFNDLMLMRSDKFMSLHLRILIQCTKCTYFACLPLQSEALVLILLY